MMAMADDTSVFWDRLAERYAAQKVADPEGWERTLSRVRHYMRATDSVLELGAGTGSSAIKLADGCAQYLATDYAAEMVRIAETKGAGVAGLRFARAGMDLAGLDGPYDMVVALNLLHLVPDLDAGLARVREVLTPGGYFVSKTVCLGRDWYLRPVIGLMRALGKAPEVAFLRPDALDARIAAAGFEIVETDEHNSGTRGHFVVARAV